MRTAQYLVGAASLALLAVSVVPVNAEEPAKKSPLDTYYSENLEQYQWWMSAISAFNAHEEGFTGEGAVVAVLDTGVDGTHPDLAGQTVDGADTSNMEVVPIEAGTDSDSQGHGTHVAGIIAANMNDQGITGVAPSAKIMPVKVLTDDGYGTLDGIAMGIEWAVANGADVINMSLGGSTAAVELTNKDLLCVQIANAAASGVPVIVAAGNEGAYGNPLSTPAGCPGSFSVSAINSDGLGAWFSSYDASVRAAAPGQNVFSTFATSQLASGYVSMSGTSMATPTVAGVAALLKGQNPEASAEDVYDAMTSTATDLGRPGRDPLYGYGLVSATKALGISASDATWLPTPHVQSFYESATNGKYVVNWSVPGSFEVESYQVETFPGGEVLATVGGNQVRAEVTPPSDAFSLSVVAELASGETVASEPLYLDVASGGDPFSTIVHGKWTSKGILVNVYGTDDVYKAPRDLTLVVFEDAWVTGYDKPFYREVTLKKGTSQAFIPVDRANPARGRELLAGLEGMRLGPFDAFYRIGAQWPVAVNVIRVSKAQVTIGGELNRCPPSAQFASIEGCVGRQIAVVDRTGRTLQRGAVAADIALTPFSYSIGYSLTVTKPPKKVRVVIGTWRSPLVSVPAK